MMKNSFIHTPLRVLLVGSNFCRKNEPRDAYGASCLVSAFRNSPTNAGDTLDVFTSDLNRFQKLNGDFNIDRNLVASEVVTRALIGCYNVVAFSVFTHRVLQRGRVQCFRLVRKDGCARRRRTSSACSGNLHYARGSLHFRE